MKYIVVIAAAGLLALCPLLSLAATCHVSSSDLTGSQYGKTRGDIKSLKLGQDGHFTADTTKDNAAVEGEWRVQGNELNLSVPDNPDGKTMRYTLLCGDNPREVKVLKGVNPGGNQSILYLESKEPR